MRHIILKEGKEDTYQVAVLIKDQALQKDAMVRNYIMPLEKLGFKDDGIIAFNLKYNTVKKVSAAYAKEYLATLMPAMKHLKIKYLLVNDSEYYKQLTGAKKVESSYGSVVPCKFVGYEHINVVLGINHQALFYNPAVREKLDLSFSALVNHSQGTYTKLGGTALREAHYVNEISEAKEFFTKLHAYPELTLDLETFSLDFWKAGIGTFSFSWDKHSGVAFQCDYTELVNPYPDKKAYGFQINNQEMKSLLREFIETYKGKLIYHNVGYDTKVLVYELWMNKDMLNNVGMTKGINIVTSDFECTKLITYLATNTTAGNKLDLKSRAHEHLGDYAQEEIKDIRRIPLHDLMTYNIMDCIGTFFVRDKYYPIMVTDQQEEIYKTLFKPSVKKILRMELVGMPLNMEEVKKVNTELRGYEKDFITTLSNNSIIKKFKILLQEEIFVSQNEEWKTKQEPFEYFEDHVKAQFNQNSPIQISKLLFSFIGLPVQGLTDTKKPSTDGDALADLNALKNTPEVQEILSCLIGLSELSTILSNFLSNFLEKAVLKADGTYYLHGNFNLGGTKSGRMSSSGPNMQNIPSTGSKYAKHIKRCFQAPQGWFFLGADSASLEDRISALLTKDTNKLKVYLDGFDGHCLRAFSYFGSQLPNIINTVDSINSIKNDHDDLRQRSKSPTFLLTYGGTHIGIVRLGFTPAEALSIEANYHKLYAESDKWVAGKISEASDLGYVTIAFGLRLRCPILKQTVLGNRRTPFEAEAEGRTVGNALGQSYGLLNNRAGNELMERLAKSEFVEDILPVADIHDAMYFLVRDNIHAIEWLNTNLIECMSWQELPAIKHDKVKLGANLAVYYPSWAHEISLPNNIDAHEIKRVCNEAMIKLAA
jgi:DNA polymerase-1